MWIELAPIGFGFAALAALVMAFGQLTVRRRPHRHVDWSSPLDPGRRLRADILVPRGTLRVHEGPDSRVSAHYDLDGNTSEPHFDYRATDRRARVEMRQAAVRVPGLRRNTNDCDIELAADVVHDLRLRMGAGHGELDLSHLTVEHVEVDVGRAEVDIDLSGPRDRDVSIQIKGGVGAARVRLPSRVGVAVHLLGVRALEALGLHRVENVWVNDAYGLSPHTIHLHVRGELSKLFLDATTA